MNTVFVVQHVHVFQDGDSNLKLIGVFRDMDAALVAVEQLARQPGFCEQPAIWRDGGYGEAGGDTAGFHINGYLLDEVSWDGGYVTV